MPSASSNQDWKRDKSTSKIMYVSTEEAYARWASVYDTDGNFLQATDDMQLEELLPRFLTLAEIPSVSEPRGELSSRQCMVIDLGCGTGRNTLKLRALTDESSVRVIGLDSSREMLDVASRKQKELVERFTIQDGSILLALYDIQDPARTPVMIGANPYSEVLIPEAKAVMSTLVIEHVELMDFFQAAKSLMKPQGLLLVTNMHSDMGAISQAGFVNKDGVKVRPHSIAHKIAEVDAEARNWGFHGLEYYEKEIAESDVKVLGQRSKKWVGVKCWFAIIFKLESE